MANPANDQTDQLPGPTPQPRPNTRASRPTAAPAAPPAADMDALLQQEINTRLEEEEQARLEAEEDIEAAVEDSIDPEFDDIQLTQEDLNLLAQAGKQARELAQIWLANEARNMINHLVRTKRLPRFYFHEEAEKIGVPQDIHKNWRIRDWPYARINRDPRFRDIVEVLYRVNLRLIKYPLHETYVEAIRRLRERVQHLKILPGITHHKLSQHLRVSYKTLQELLHRRTAASTAPFFSVSLVDVGEAGERLHRAGPRRPAEPLPAKRRRGHRPRDGIPPRRPPRRDPVSGGPGEPDRRGADGPAGRPLLALQRALADAHLRRDQARRAQHPRPRLRLLRPAQPHRDPIHRAIRPLRELWGAVAQPAQERHRPAGKRHSQMHPMPEAEPRGPGPRRVPAEQGDIVMTTAQAPAKMLLNDRQQEAAQDPEGAIQIIGGPGSGKTHTLIARTMALLRSGVSPSYITYLTFSSRGADQTRHRISDYVADQEIAKRLFIGTFHHYASTFLRQAGAPLIGRSASYTLWDHQQAKDAISNLVEQDPGQLTIPTNELKNFLQWHGLNRARWGEDPSPPQEAYWYQLVDLYTQEKQRQNVLDLDDLIPLAIRAMDSTPGPAGSGTRSGPGTCSSTSSKTSPPPSTSSCSSSPGRRGRSPSQPIRTSR